MGSNPGSQPQNFSFVCNNFQRRVISVSNSPDAAFRIDVVVGRVRFDFETSGHLDAIRTTTLVRLGLAVAVISAWTFVAALTLRDLTIRECCRGIGCTRSAVTFEVSTACA